MDEQGKDKVEIYEDEGGEYRWRRVAVNGEGIIPPESHPRREDAKRAAVRALDPNWEFAEGD